MNRAEEIITLLKKVFPGPAPKPSKSDPLDVLIATMLSQNTTDKTSYRAFKNLKDNFKNWEEVMNAPLNRIKDSIRVCGLTNRKSAGIKKMLVQMKKKYGSLSLEFIKKLRDEEIYDELLVYNGVGLKTISCVLAFGLGRDVFPVDTHVHRLCNRLGLANTNAPDKTFLQVKDLVPKGKRFLLHTMLIKFGRKVCRAKNPLCSKCVLYDICVFEDRETYAMSESAEPKENNFIILEHV